MFVWMGVWVHACVGVGVCACLRACMRAQVHVCACVYVLVRVAKANLKETCPPLSSHADQIRHQSPRSFDGCATRFEKRIQRLG